MKKRLFAFFVLMIGMVAEPAKAQYDPVFAHYWDQETSYNPAAAGKNDVMHVAAAYNMTMMAFERAPKTMTAAADMPVHAMGSYHGLGALFLNDQIGLFSHQRIALQYALRKKLLAGNLSVGIQAGLLTEKFDGSDLDLEDPSDPAFASSELKGNSLDLAAGVYYKTPQWYAGLSAQHLTGPTVSLGERNEIKVDPTLYFTAGYNIQLRNPLIKIQPSVFAVTDMTEYKANMTCRLFYTHDEKTYYCGLGYSPAHSVSAYIGGSFNGISVGYSYEMYTGPMMMGNGGHELSLTYETKLDFGKHGRNLHKSVRLL